MLMLTKHCNCSSDWCDRTPLLNGENMSLSEDLIVLTIFWSVFVLTYSLLMGIEYKMWEDWFYGKKSWWNILYKNR